MGEQPASLLSVLHRSTNIFKYCVKGKTLLQELSSSSPFLVLQFSRDVPQACTQRLC